MFDEAISLLSIWTLIQSWLTPTILFILLNLMIGTIFVTSGGFTSSTLPHQGHNHHNTVLHHHHQQQQQQEHASQLTRAPSILQRLKSINFYSYVNNVPQQQLQAQTTNHGSAIEADKSVPLQQFHASSQTQIRSQTPHIEEDIVDEAGDAPTLDEIYSKIKGVHYNRQNSDTQPIGGEIPVKLPAKMKKSGSDKSAFNHFHVENTASAMKNKEVVEVDAMADDFINRFKKQLQLQRMESIAQYKEMIARGSGH